MKKLVILLLFAATGKALSAQVIIAYGSTPASELTFNSPLIGKSNNRFDFYLPNNNRMIIEVQRLHIIQQLPDLDSLFAKIWEDLKPIYDSLTDPLMLRRVDYVNIAKQVKIRVKQYTPSGTYYSYKDDELVQMKVDQDTLRFRGYIKPEPGKDRGVSFLSSYYTVTLLLNNITDVAKLQDGILQSGVELVLKDLEHSLEKSARRVDNYYYGAYDMKTRKRISPRNDKYMGYGKRVALAPYAQAGIQFVRGAFVPSAGLGIEYSNSEYNLSKNAIRLIWEPYFYFKRDDKDKVIMQRNDFITLKFYTGYNPVGNPSRTFSWNQNFSLGAMIYRKGELFEKGTFKFTLPGLQTKNILIEPEFFFNKFFRNFSPSMRLTVNLD
jgi:hypothetical protein